MMNLPTIHRFVVLAALAWAPALSVSAQDRFVDSRAGSVQAFLRTNFSKGESGMVIGLLDQHGTKVFGAGNPANGTGREIDGDTVFEIGSVTKTFTSLLLLDTVRRGEMKLDDPVANYLPAQVVLPTRGENQVTLRHLAAQDSGLPFDADYVWKDGKILQGVARWRAFNAYTAPDMYAFLAKYRLRENPGARFQYSNIGMSLLGHALERKAGADYESLVVKRICGPLKMDSTRITLTPKLQSLAATGHGKYGRPTDYLDLKVIAPAGALKSTANDLLKYLATNLGLQKSDLTPLMAEMHTIRHRGAPEMGNTAMPWYDNAVYNPPGSDLLGHSGATHGFSAFVGFDKKKRRGVVVLSNQRTISAGGIGWAILQEMPLSKATGSQLVREHVGIGIGLGAEGGTGNIQVISVFPESPAVQAGLEIGQIIQKINDIAVAGKSPEECIRLMPGPIGTKVRLELFDPKLKKSKTVELTKQKFLTLSEKT